ncbi:MAG: response regulator [Nostoc sp.]|uniref:response regulator n=2 Tax=Nostoc sp. TaxID=1180 RepID=UPI002FF982B2
MPDNFEDTRSEKDTRDLDIFQGLTILVVDDSTDILFLITYIFESYGIQVITASNASAAFEIIKQYQVDLLIIDIAMPLENGYSLIQKVRSLTSPLAREIPAIAFTGSSEDKVDKKALASGFQTYIQKPSDLEQFITEVAKLLQISCKRMAIASILWKQVVN